ncbi:MAG: LysR family transcriptional regulator [Oscillospiraceae bacterium]|nr:LysR family transcriptional regulator [Oscillospiraceae bacterium]
MDIRTLQYFLAIAREKSITGAAEVLHMTQPPLSRQMRELEGELGKKLFIRGNRSITLTDEGMILRKRAEQIVSLMEIAHAEINAVGEQLGGDIYIGAAETVGLRCIAQGIKTLQQKYPGIHFHFYSGHANDITERLDRGLLDFGIVLEPVDLQRYDYIKLPNVDTWGLLMPSNCPLAKKQTIHPEDLEGLPILFTNQTLTDNIFSGWMGSGFSNLNIVVTYDLLFNTSILVEEGVGYALCLDKIIRLGENDILTFRPLEPALEVGLYLIWKKYQSFTKAASVFLDTLHMQFSADG